MRSILAGLILALPLAAQAQTIACDGQIQVGPVQLGAVPIDGEGGRGGGTYRDFSATFTNLTGRTIVVVVQVRGLPGAPLPITREIEAGPRQSRAANVARLPGTSTVTVQQVQAGMRVSCPSNRLM
ncbi:MAG: hypothetical protein K2X11_12030 [Acetobacteraceae bacterium]|nr:hypothetical protein [Acetobacteraceae bacterium]